MIDRAVTASTIRRVIEAVKTLAAFDRQLWSYSLDLFRGGDSGAFVDGFASSISNQLRRAWREGAGAVGVAPADMSEDDIAHLQATIDNEHNYVLDLAQAIEDAGKSGETLDQFRTQFRPRIELWSNRYTEVVNDAKVWFGDKQRLKWVYGDTEHCDTCASLNGIVAYASEWKQSGLRPQNPPNDLLECGGWRCQCKLETTTDKRSPDALGTLMDIATGGNV